jgi:hypothetical protein
MPQPPRPLLVVAASVCLALLADLLLRGASWGLNLGLLAMGVSTTFLWLEKRTHIRLSKVGRSFGALSILFAVLFSLRDSDALKAANSLALVFCVGAMLLSTTGESLPNASFAKMLLGSIRQWLRLPVHAIALTNRARYDATPSERSKERANSVARGTALALPLLLVFGGLFASADPVFKKSLQSFLQPNLDFDAVAGHCFTLLISLVLLAGLLHALVLRDDRPEPPPAITRSAGYLGATELGIVLGSLTLLFASFIGVQFRYLFGARHTVEVTPGLSYAEYARGGFFELVWVAALALVVLLGTHALLKREERGSERLFRWLGRSLVVMVFGVVGSALLRMKLYTDAFGLTELRVYSTVFMGWLTIAFAWMLATTLNRRSERFAFGALLSGLGVVLLTNLMDPEGVIVRTNLSKSNADFAYLMSLSDDALMSVRSAQGSLSAPQREAYLGQVQKRHAAQTDWRELNLSRWSLTH